MIAAHRDACSPSWSTTIRTARARTSGENLLLVCFVMAPPSQELEPPINPGRFTMLLSRHSRTACSSFKSVGEIAPKPTGHGLPLGKCEAYSRVYDQSCGSS